MKKLANKAIKKAKQYARRKNRTNTMCKMNSDTPRLIVNRSNKYMFAQIVSPDGIVVTALSDRGLSGKTKSERAFALGEQIAGAAKKKKVDNVVFDRNGFLYHGRVKQVAEGARSGGLQL